MVTEGTYPQAFGGVSVWCDQIIRGLPEHHFDIAGICITGTEKSAWQLPPNVTFTPIPLWASGPGPKRPGRRLRTQVADAYHQMLLSLLAEPQLGLPAFTESLRKLVELSDEGPIGPVLRDEQAVGWLLDAWRGAPRVAAAGATLTVHDALTITDVLEHWLRPLLQPVPAGQVTHAVTNGLAALVGLAAKWRHGTPMLLTEHGIYLRERYLSFNSAGFGWSVRLPLLSFLRQVSAAAYKAADLVTPGNKYNRRWEEYCGADPGRIETVYNGVDPADFAPAGPEPAVPTVSWAGRVDPIKDLETLIRSFALVRRQLPAARLRIFGGTPKGNESYLARCEKLAAELAVADAVTFEGRVDNIADAYAAGHVVVLSSISEGFPYTVIEAMTSGRATVSTDVGGVSEAVGDTGLVVPPRDPAAMAEACLTLLRDDLRRHKLGAAARQRALEYFTVDRAVGSFRGIYAALAEGRDPTRRLEISDDDDFDTEPTRILRLA